MRWACHGRRCKALGKSCILHTPLFDLPLRIDTHPSRPRAAVGVELLLLPAGGLLPPALATEARDLGLLELSALGLLELGCSKQLHARRGVREYSEEL